MSQALPTEAPAMGCPLQAPAGCPVSAGAAAFDAFEGPYQVDPAEDLRWSRAREPVFYSPKLGYWVVSRYEHVKAVFRGNAAFSPSIALEKTMPASPQGQRRAGPAPALSRGEKEQQIHALP